MTEEEGSFLKGQFLRDILNEQRLSVRRLVLFIQFCNNKAPLLREQYDSIFHTRNTHNIFYNDTSINYAYAAGRMYQYPNTPLSKKTYLK